MLAKWYKHIFDISICYTIGAFLLKLFGGITISGKSYLILLITALVSVLPVQKRLWKNAAVIAILAGYLAFFLPAVPELAVFLLIGAYNGFITITGRDVISRGVFADQLRYFLYSLLLLPILLVTEYYRCSAAVQTGCIYFIAALVSAIFLLRHLRVENQMKQMRQYRRQQVTELLVFLGISMLLTFARVLQNLAEGLKMLYLHMIAPILSFLMGIIGALLGGIIYLFLAVINIFSKGSKTEEVKISLGKTVQKSLHISKSVDADWVIPCLYSLGVILGLVLLFFFFRWLMGEKFRQGVPAGVLETRETVENDADQRGIFPNRCPKEPRAAVRFYYRRCLLWLQKKRLELNPQDTTDAIHKKYLRLEAEQQNVQKEASKQLNQKAQTDALEQLHPKSQSEASAQFMQLYRKARYQMSEQITKEEADRAKKLYHTMKSGKKYK